MNPEPRVLLFTDADVFAGTERHILDLARALRDQSASVAVACPKPSVLGERAAAENIEHVVIQKRGLYDCAAVRTLRSLLASDRFNVIHAHNGRTMLAAALAVRGAGRGRCVATQHFIAPNHAGHRGLKRLVSHAVHGWVNCRVHAHVAISEAVRRAAITRGEMDAASIHLVHNGISDPAIGELRRPEEVRDEFGIAPDAPLIVCAARLEAEKGIADLLHALVVVAKSSPRTRCLIAGDGALRADLERLASDLGVGSSVTFAGFRADALSLLGAADVLVLPSPAEPFGLAVVEAMALRVPVVATRAGGPMEIVADGETGLLVPSGDVEALAGAIVGLLQDPARRAAMGRAGRERFEAHFTSARMAREMAAVYRAVLA